jgi:hypothetical protein
MAGFASDVPDWLLPLRVSETLRKAGFFKVFPKMLRLLDRLDRPRTLGELKRLAREMDWPGASFECLACKELQLVSGLPRTCAVAEQCPGCVSLAQLARCNKPSSLTCAGALNTPRFCGARRCLSRARSLDWGQRQGIDPQRLEAFSRLAAAAVSDPEGLYVVSTTNLGPDAFGRKLYSNSIQTGT